jgi:hypothetical protein
MAETWDPKTRQTVGKIPLLTVSSRPMQLCMWRLRVQVEHYFTAEHISWYIGKCGTQGCQGEMGCASEAGVTAAVQQQQPTLGPGTYSCSVFRLTPHPVYFLYLVVYVLTLMAADMVLPTELA